MKNSIATAFQIFEAGQVLTINIAEQLKGQRIKTVYSGYSGQDDGDDFIVGDMKKEIYHNGSEGEICLFTADNRNTYIRAHTFNNGDFTCSDSDRLVFYIVMN